ncbi:succinate-semialdehyde dehydrogenase [NADP(+)] [Physcia stellaris]|nr:succinate-semialdehyde dehydrogenase [NADP(+)] [Physcia stellaris]
MDFDIIDVLKGGEMTSSYIIFYYDPANSQNPFQLMSIGNYSSHCLTQSSFLRISSQVHCCTASTDGHIALWPLDLAFSGRDTNGPKEACWKYDTSLGSITVKDSLYFTKRIQVHQSSINCMTTLNLSDADVLIATVSDDGALAFIRVSGMSTPQSTHGNQSGDPEGRFSSCSQVKQSTILLPKAHSSTVDALIYLGLDRGTDGSEKGHRFLTCGKDQRLKTWKLTAKLEQPGIHGFTVIREQDTHTSIADVSSLECMAVDHPPCGAVLVAGVGFEQLTGQETIDRSEIRVLSRRESQTRPRGRHFAGLPGTNAIRFDVIPTPEPPARYQPRSELSPKLQYGDEIPNFTNIASYRNAYSAFTLNKSPSASYSVPTLATTPDNSKNLRHAEPDHSSGKMFLFPRGSPSQLTIEQLKDQSLFKQDGIYVNGEWAKAKSGQTFEVTDPSTDKVVGTCPECSKEDVDNAINAAAEAFKSFRKTTPRERARMLRKWYQLMVDNSEDIAKLITWENGKPFNDAKGEAAYAASFFEWFSEEAPRIDGDTIQASIAGNRVFTIKEPVGVCGLITPWNFPAAMITRKIGPAIAAGCTVVCKSPGETPFTSLALVELASRAGIPKGVINIVSALKNTVEVGEALTSNAIVRKVSFTGSTGVGKLLMKQSSDTLKKLSFELAVNGAIACKFRSSGQTCVCANRIYVQKGIYDKFATSFAEKVKSFKVGGGYDEGVTHGPLIHDRAVSKVDAHKMPDLGSNFFQPTVITGMTMDMKMASEETFGPVAGIYPFDTEQDVVEMANKSEVGLAGYFYSNHLQRVYRVAEALEVGMVGVNTGLISDPAAPFGGVKFSGFGREGSKYGISEYQTTKTVTLGGMGQPLQGS